MDATLPDSDHVSPGEYSPPEAGAPELLTRAMGALFGRGGILLVSFGFAVLAARSLDPASRGDFALLQATTGLTTVLANFAIGGAVVYHLGKGRLSPERTLGAASVLAGASGGLAAVALIPFALLARGSLFPEISPLLIVAAIVLATPLLLREYVGGTLIALGRPQRYVLSHAIHPAAAILTLGGVLMFGGATVGTIMAGWGVGVTASALVALLFALALIPGRPKLVSDDLLTLGRFGIRTYPALLARFLNLRVDQFLVRVLASAAVLGNYAVAVNVGELLIQIPVVLLWAFSGAMSSAHPDESSDLAAQFCRWSLVILMGAALLVAALTPVGLPLVFGSRYRDAVTSVLLLLPGMVLYAPAAIVSEYFVVQRGRPAKAALIAGASILTSICLNLLLTPSLGAAGASIASSVSYGMMFAAAIALFAVDTRRPARTLFTVSRQDLIHMIHAVRHWRSVPASIRLGG